MVEVGLQWRVQAAGELGTFVLERACQKFCV